jgi:hypothetical protein
VPQAGRRSGSGTGINSSIADGVAGMLAGVGKVAWSARWGMTAAASATFTWLRERGGGINSLLAVCGGWRAAGIACSSPAAA